MKEIELYLILSIIWGKMAKQYRWQEKTIETNILKNNFTKLSKHKSLSYDSKKLLIQICFHIFVMRNVKKFEWKEKLNNFNFFDIRKEGLPKHNMGNYLEKIRKNYALKRVEYFLRNFSGQKWQLIYFKK